MRSSKYPGMSWGGRSASSCRPTTESTPFGTGRTASRTRCISSRCTTPLDPDYQTVLVSELVMWQSRADSRPDRFPAPLFPTLPGLLPWGDDIDGGMMGWLVNGDPPEWPIVLVGGRGNPA